MNAQNKETDARILIDDQLRAAGWDPADKSHVLTEVKVPRGHFVAEPEAQPAMLSTSDGDAIPTGRADYVLLGACQNFCVERGHEIIPKGLFHDRSDDHQEAQKTESSVPVSR